MSDLNLTTHNFKAEALILISGMGSDEAVLRAGEVLNTYNLKILEQQKISIKGRLIAVFHIAFDPAHAVAIQDELAAEMKKHHLDVALDIL